MSLKALADYWKLDATVHLEHDIVEERRFFSDYKRNIRRQERKVVWHRDKILGYGSYGVVRLEINREDQTSRAVKKIDLSTAPSHSEYPVELNALLEFSQPRSKEQDLFVEFFGWFRHGCNLFLAMEYIEMGDLETYVVKHPGEVNEIGARVITKQILLGLEFMHGRKFAHRDLKPENVMVVRGAPEWWVKLADFGLSKRLVNRETFTSNGGTKPYMAPELRCGSYLGTSSRGYTYAVDLWAMGCIAYRLVAGAVPFPPEYDLTEFCRDESLFPLQHLIESNVGDSCRSFIKALLTTSPTDRPSAAEALNHNWIKPANSTDSTAPELQEPASSPTPEREPSVATFSDIRWDSDINRALRTLNNMDTSTIPPLARQPTIRLSTELVGGEAEGGDEELMGTQAETQRPREGDTVAELQKQAALLNDQQRYGEAEAIYRSVIAEQRQLLGKGHPDRLKSKYELANTLVRQENYEEAERIYRIALKKQERALGPRDRDTLKTKNGLAGVLYQQYKYDAAEAEYRETVSARQEVLGETHRDTLTSMSNHAKTLFEQGRFKEAEEIYWSTLAGRRQVLGKKHRDTLTTMNGLADTLLSQGHYKNAEELHRKTLARREQVLGFAHPETLTSMHNVADSLYRQNDFQAAKERYQMALSGRREVLGGKHPDTLATLKCLKEVSRPQRRRSRS